MRCCKGAWFELLLCCLKTRGQWPRIGQGPKALIYGAFKTTSTSSSSEDITIFLCCSVVGLKGALSYPTELVELLEAIDYSGSPLVNIR